MGNAILIILFSSFFLYGVLSLGTNNVLEQATTKSVEHHTQMRARNIANSMVLFALSKLADDKDWRANQTATKKLFDGTVSYTVTDKTFDGQDLVQIKAEAEYFGTSYKVIAYTDPSVTRTSVPPFFKYAVLAGEKFTANFEDNRVTDASNPMWNANTHSNGVTLFNGQNYIQEGFVTYSDNLIYDPVDVTITPNQNPEGDPVTSKAPPIYIPDFDAEDYKSYADLVYNGDMTFNGTITLGTKDNPKIIYVGGKLYLEGTTFQGYGIFIVKNIVEIKGDVVPDTPDPLVSKLAIYTNNNFIVNHADVDVHAQVFAMGNVILNGENINFYCSIISKKDVIFNGHKIDMLYKPPNPSLIDPFRNLPAGGGRLAILYYNEQ